MSAGLRRDTNPFISYPSVLQKAVTLPAAFIVLGFTAGVLLPRLRHRARLKRSESRFAAFRTAADERTERMMPDPSGGSAAA